MKNKVEIRLAYEFTCDDCGRDQFIRAMQLDPSQLSEEEHTELRNEHGVQPWEEGSWSMRPNMVRCGFCKSEFETE